MGALLVKLGRRQLVIGAKPVVGLTRKLANHFILTDEVAEAVKDRLALVEFHPAQKMWAVSDDDICTSVNYGMGKLNDEIGRLVFFIGVFMSMNADHGDVRCQFRFFYPTDDRSKVFRIGMADVSSALTNSKIHAVEREYPVWRFEGKACANAKLAEFFQPQAFGHLLNHGHLIRCHFICAIGPKRIEASAALHRMGLARCFLSFREG